MLKRARPALILCLGLTSGCIIRTGAQPSQPPQPAAQTPVKPLVDPALHARTVDVKEELFGVTVPDEYRWMETQTEELVDWVEKHGTRTRGHLDALAQRDQLQTRILELIDEDQNARSVARRGERVFFLRQVKGQTQPSLVVRDNLSSSDRVLFDPAKQKEAGSIDNYMPSPDGSVVALNWSNAGAERGAIRFIDVNTGALLPDILPRIWGEFPAHWAKDGKSVAYTQMLPLKKGVDPMLNMKVKHHVLGQPAEQDAILLDGTSNPTLKFVPQEFPILEFSGDGKWAIATGQGARSDVQIAVASTKGLSDKTKWNYIANYDGQISGYTVHSNKLYVLTTKGAPNGQVQVYDLKRPGQAPTTLIAADPQSTISSIHSSKNGLFVETQKNGVESLSWYNFGTKSSVPVPLAVQGSILDMETSSTSDEILLRQESWTQAPKFYQWSPTASTASAVNLPSPTPVDFSGVTVERVEVPSQGGAMVPMTLIYRKDLKKDKSTPFHVRAYGGYGMTMLPRYFPSQLAWLEQGGGLAFVHVRGSGAKGRAWHEGGRGKNKHIGVADLIAGIKYLDTQGYSSPKKIGVQGTSMGGVLVGGALVAEPSAFGATILSVPILNPLRILAAPNGANQIAELGGSPETQEGFTILHAMDPYTKIAQDGGYPETMFEVGLHDNRVALWHPAKFAARLIAKNPQTQVWIRPDADGHGIGTPRDKIAQKLADRYAFLLHALADKKAPPKN